MALHIRTYLILQCVRYYVHTASLKRKLCYALKNGYLRDTAARQLHTQQQQDPQNCPVPPKAAARHNTSTRSSIMLAAR